MSPTLDTRQRTFAMACHVLWLGQLPVGFALIVLYISGADKRLDVCRDQDEALIRARGTESLDSHSVCFG